MSKRTIPRLAIATLTLGGACSDGDGDGSGAALKTEGVNATPARARSIAREVCSQFKTCDAEEFETEFASQTECEKSFTDYVATIDDTACGDAFLDSYGCYSQLACDIDNGDYSNEAANECEDLYQRVEDLCDDESDNDSSSSSSPGYDDYDY